MEYVICHHGILGQKWGKRNGPPYPLDVGSYSTAEKKAGKLGRKIDKYNAKAGKAERKSIKLANKADKRYKRKKIYKRSKSEQEEFLRKESKKQQKYIDKQKKNLVKVNRYKSEVDRIVNSLNDRGYSLTSEELLTRARIGREATRKALIAVAAVEIGMAAAGYGIKVTPRVRKFIHIVNNLERVRQGIGSVRA